MSQVISITKYDDLEMRAWAREMRTPSPGALRWFLIEQIMCFVVGMF
jgi:hypothetical protein